MAGDRNGFFARHGHLFRGGPAEGFLQSFHPAARLLALFVTVCGLSLSTNVVVIASSFAGIMALALASFLSVISIFQLLLVPVILFVLPSWGFAVLIGSIPAGVAGNAVLRTTCCILTGSVFLHSIGLLNVARALRWLRLPDELCLAWHMMIVQASSFFQLKEQMVLAGESRQLFRRGGNRVRRQLGGQMGMLLARMNQRSREIAMATDARHLGPGAQASGGALDDRTLLPENRFALRDFTFISAAVVVAVTVALA